ncbi:flagellin [Roseburia inulinivorans]|uniref:flagellin N-terminal helical domain-containing protein n=1 Tax=Roseburia inulinivorans TaxID=360807 RepID=UPI003AB6F8A8
MVVQHNLTAMNANRQLGITTGAQAKSSEKLSSGYRINRAGDDAAGLKISEKMRSQIRGLDKASSNAQDGISLIQTAEGALGEAHSILQRMNELAVQGANDTNESIDRDAINEELAALTSELDRIASTTQFNKQNLLDGSFTSKNLQVGANSDQKISISIGKMNSKALGLHSITGTTTQSQTGKKVTGFTFGKYSTKATDSTAAFSDQAKDANASLKAAVDADKTEAAYMKQIDFGTGSAYYMDATGKRYKVAASAMSADATALKSAISDIFYNWKTKAATYANTENVIADKTTVGQATQLTDPSVKDYASANATIDAVQKAINSVSSQRSALGALQNRLEHTVANLDNVSENTSSAESRIRDTDMADEMVEYSKNNILAQAGQSMLAQANQSTQGVLSLLQ